MDADKEKKIKSAYEVRDGSLTPPQCDAKEYPGYAYRRDEVAFNPGVE